MRGPPTIAVWRAAAPATRRRRAVAPGESGRGIVVQSADDPPTVLNLAPGSAATFGRGNRDTPVDLVLPDAAVSRLAGRITAVEDYWLISNLSLRSTYVIEN